jgi:hypothetical protein
MKLKESRILVVDDDQDVLTAVRLLLRPEIQNSRPHANWNHIYLNIIWRLVSGKIVFDWFIVSKIDSTALLNLGVDRP